MLRIILNSYMVRYPLGGMMSAILQWVAGFQRLGHEIYLVEKSGWPDSCFDPSKGIMSDDCSYGTKNLNALLGRFGLQDRWCFVDAQGRYHGLSSERVEALFKGADLFVDWGPHGEWTTETANVGLQVLVDPDPGFEQMKMENQLAIGQELPDYDYYYTVGRNVGTDRSTAPTVGKRWRPLFPPVVVDLFPWRTASDVAPFSTVMNWQSYESITFDGMTYGQKDIEFDKFMTLPRRLTTTTPMEIAVSGKNVPTKVLQESGWRIRDAHAVTASCDSYWEYIRTSKGEFSVCKNVFVATNSGWFSDRSAAYLASGRPVVLQDTGFGAHLPCGRGLFAVRTVDEAAAAIDEINGDYEHHSKCARDIAVEYLDAPKVLKHFLGDLGT